MATLAPRRLDRRTAADDLAFELRVRQAELLADLEALFPAADAFVRIAPDYSPTIHQQAVGLRRRLYAMRERECARVEVAS